MARVSHIKKSRVERLCHRGHVIPVGSAYSYAAPGYHGREIYACTEHPFRPSNLTTGARAEALAAIEAFEDAANAIEPSSPSALEELEAALEDLKSELENYRDMRQEALDAWEYGNSQLEELLDVAESALSEVENHSVDEWDGDEDIRDAEEPVEPTDGFTNDTNYMAWQRAHEEWEQVREDWAAHVQGQIDAAFDVVQGLEV